MNDAEYRIKQVVTTITQGHVFWSHLALRLRMIADSSIADPNTTFGYATDGTHLFYNPDKIMSQDKATITWGITHEIGHCMFGHPWRKGNRNDGKWTYACEPQVNFMTKDAGLVVPDGAVMPGKFIGMHTEKIYALLPDTKHRRGACGLVLSPPSCSSTGKQPISEAEWQAMTQQAAKIAREHGSLPGNLESLIDPVGQSSVDWRTYVRQWWQAIGMDDYTLVRPNKPFRSFGLYIPSLESTQVQYAITAVDSSGSTIPLLPAFIREVASIHAEMRPVRHDIIYSDCEVQRVESYGPDDDIDLTVKGLGGTDFAPVFDYIAKSGEQPTRLIYITDLDGPFPKEAPDYPVLWVVPRGTQSVAPFGEMIYIDSEE